MSTIENLQLYDLLVEHFGSRQNIVSSCDSKGNICFYYPPRMEKLDIIVCVFPTNKKDIDVELQKAIDELNEIYPNTECIELCHIGENRIVNLRSDSPANIEALTKFVEDMKSNEKNQETV